MAISIMKMGYDGNKIKVNVKWIGIIKYLFDVAISKKEDDPMKYDKYIYSTFECFVKQKTKLEFDMTQLSNYCSKDFRNLMIGKLKRADRRYDVVRIRSMVNDGDNINLPKKEIFNVFYNVHELGLDLGGGWGLYPISLSSLLLIIKSNPSLQLIRIRLVHLRNCMRYQWNWKQNNQMQDIVFIWRRKKVDIMVMEFIVSLKKDIDAWEVSECCIC